MNKKLEAIAEQLRSNPYEASGSIYHPLPFPEFDDLVTSSKSESAYRKWNLIRSCFYPTLEPTGYRVLDVGANAGFYSFNLAKLGAIVDAYEPHEHYASIGAQIAEATALPVFWHNKPIEQSDLNGKSYDIALMLSVFQWMSQGDQNLTSATELLRLIASSSKFLFFELGCNSGKSAIHADGLPIKWIWNLLRENTEYNLIAFLGIISAWGRSRRYLFAGTNDKLRLTVSQRIMTSLLSRRLILW
jgi:SAM-dependent methyltransferase